MLTPAQIATLHELHNNLVALRLDVVGKFDQAMMIVESLMAAGNCNVQLPMLDIVAAAGVCEHVQTDRDAVKNVPCMVQLRPLESEITLLGDASVPETDEQHTATVIRMNDEPVDGETSKEAEHFLYSSFMDSKVIAAEMAWWTAQAAAMECSAHDVEFIDTDGPCDPVVTNGETSEPSNQQCSENNPEVVPALPSQENTAGNHAPSQPAIKSQGSSASSGSKGKNKRKRVYRPPAKGQSTRLTQEQVNFISLQRLKK
ncbi:hypothetical protein BJ741DRAFT_669429 [Chytriomyces cf. hyalinus JEL632]|nr:hypothetical protein BJ741DRAFT_669429 [Chytriomyces cf. hyalinus JEL632]